MSSDSDIKKYEKTYHTIVSFYDLAEKLIDTVEDADVADPVAQLEFIEPLVKQIEEATDALSEEYRDFIRTGKKPGVLTKGKVERSLRTLYSSLNECENACTENNEG